MPTLNEDLQALGNVFIANTLYALGFIRTAAPQGLSVSDLQTVATFPAVLAGNVDPSAAAGRSGPIGSLYMRTTTPPELWQKIGAADTAWSQVVGGSAVLSGSTLTLTGDITPASIGPGAVPNYAPTGIATASRIRQAVNAGGATLTGLAAQPAGRILALYNLGTGPMLLSHEGGGSTPANRFNLPNDEDAYLPIGCGFIFIYDGGASRWQLWAQSTTRDVSREIDTLNVHDQQGGFAFAIFTSTDGDPNTVISAPAGSLCMDTSTPATWQNVDGADTWSRLATTDAAVDVGWFGDGTDGVLVAGVGVAASPLTRDIYPSTLTIPAGVSLDCGGFRIFVRDSLVFGDATSTIHANGNAGQVGNAATGPAGGARTGGTLPGSSAGGAGTAANGVAGGNGVGISNAPGDYGTTTGGAGGTGTAAGGVGGASALGAASRGRLNMVKYAIDALTQSNALSGNAGIVSVGPGGGGGSGQSSNAGGGGGGGGAYVMVSARRTTGAGRIQAIGGAGGNASPTGTNAGGGGGGKGGYLVFVFGSVNPLPTLSAAGGAGGTGIGTGTNGANGADGQVRQFPMAG